MGASACDISNLSDLSPGTPIEYMKQQAYTSSISSLTVAKNALTSGHPNLKQVIIPESAPSYDQYEWLNDLANKELHDAKEALPEGIRRGAEPGLE